MTLCFSHFRTCSCRSASSLGLRGLYFWLIGPFPGSVRMWCVIFSVAPKLPSKEKAFLFSHRSDAAFAMSSLVLSMGLSVSLNVSTRRCRSAFVGPSSFFVLSPDFSACRVAILPGCWLASPQAHVAVTSPY